MRICIPSTVAFVALLLFISCGSSSDSGGAPEVEADDTITFPTTGASLSRDYSLTITGSGSSRIGDISISGSAGTIVFNGETLATVVYEYIPWDSAGYNLYQGIAFSETDMIVYWVYCGTSHDTIGLVYYESLNEYDMTHESASGTCQYEESASAPAFSLAEKSLAVNQLVSGFTITGDEVSLSDGQAGTYSYFGEDFTLYPFETVDCSDCGGEGWGELHSVMTNADQTKTCFTILYLMADIPDSLYSSYSICFPDLDDVNSNFGATWTAP